LSIAAGRLYVADTNNHAVRVVDLKTRRTTTLKIAGLTPPAPAPSAATGEGEPSQGPNAEEAKLTAQRLRAGADASLVIDVALPAGHHLNPSAPHRYRVSLTAGDGRLDLRPAAAGGGGAPRGSSVTGKDLKLPLRVPLRTATAGAAELSASVTIYYCREDNTGTCRIKTLAWRVPVEVVDDGAAPREIKLSAALKPVDQD
jgi:hypothetical protein